MIKKFNILLILSLLTTITLKAQSTGTERKIELFDKNWLFYQGEAEGADKAVFSDAKWQSLNVPHDWSILGKTDHDNPTGRGGGYLPAGIGWYRKHFEMDAADAQKQILITFDGIMANSDVWVNGFHLGKRPYGYTTLNYDLTGHLNFGKGKTNIISVRADNTIQPASRYYTGAGIYRHVHLTVTDPLYIATNGVFITTPMVTYKSARVFIKATLVNNTKESKTFTTRTLVYDNTGRNLNFPYTNATKHTVAAGQSVTVDEDYTMTSPKLWSIETSVLYKAVTQVLVNDKVVDEQLNNFGIRDIKFDADQGFLLNGKKVMIKGVCLHHDGGAVGAAVPLAVWKRRLEILKNIGVNAIRTAHNPVAPEFLDLCDQMGFLVMDENLDTWEAKKQHAENGYGQFFKEWGLIDTRDMVIRDRNHPSIVIYSVGNEIHDNLDDSAGFKKYHDLQNIVHQYDGTRPVTMALFRPGTSKVYTNGFAKTMDVVGQNYRENELIVAHQNNPAWKVIGTENTHVLSAWLALRDHPFIAGEFLWVGFDYLGEADWPNVVDNEGLFDHTGGWKPVSYQRDSWWSEKPVVHILRKQENAGAGPLVADWTPTDFDTYDDARVSVYSNCDEVELFLNGKSLGTKTKPADDSPRDWNVTYEKGTIKAVGKNKGQEVSTDELKTAGEPAKIVLTVDHQKINNDWDDVAYVTATIVDANGVACPRADKIITFSITGAGVIAATDNGDNANQDVHTSPVRHTFNGKCIALIKGNGIGNTTVKATSSGLTGSDIAVEIVNKPVEK
jgi:beta-galactosidase